MAGIDAAHIFIAVDPLPQQNRLTWTDWAKVFSLLLMGLGMLGAGLACTFGPVNYGTPGLPLMIVSALFLLPGGYFTYELFRKCCRPARRSAATQFSAVAPPASLKTLLADLAVPCSSSAPQQP